MLILTGHESFLWKGLVWGKGESPNQRYSPFLFARWLIMPPVPSTYRLQKLKERYKCVILAGIMLYFSDLNRVFFVPYQYLSQRFDEWLAGKSSGRAAVGTASISVAECVENAVEIFRHQQNMLWDWYAYLIKLEIHILR